MSDNKEELRNQFEESLEKEFQEASEYSKLAEDNKRKAARIQNHKLTLQEEQLNEAVTLHESLKNEDITKRKFDASIMLKDLEDRKNAVTFLNEEVSKDIIAAPSSLIVVAAMTSNGKSTLTGHIIETLVNENKKVLVLSNEEKEGDVRARVSCLRKNVSFGTYKQGKCTTEEERSVILDSTQLANSGQLVVISTSNSLDAYKVTTVKGVMTTLKKAKGHFDAVILDYYQNVNKTEIGTNDPWHVNNKLAGELNIFKDSAPFPIIAFAQCKGIQAPKGTAKADLDFESNHPAYRWKGGGDINTFATDIIELTKDFEESCSYLFAHKTRFSHGDLSRLKLLPFDKKMQRFVKWTPEWDAKTTADKVQRGTKDRAEELGLDKVFDEGND